MATVAERLILTLQRTSPCSSTQQTSSSPDLADVKDEREPKTTETLRAHDDTKRKSGNKVEKLRALLETTGLGDTSVTDSELRTPDPSPPRTDGRKDEEKNAEDNTRSAANAARKDRCAIQKLQRLLESNSGGNEVTAPDIAQGSSDNIGPKSATESTSGCCDEAVQRERRDEENVSRTKSPPKEAQTGSARCPESSRKASDDKLNEVGSTCDNTGREQRATRCSATFAQRERVVPGLPGSPEPEEVRRNPPRIPRRRLQCGGRFNVVVVSIRSRSVYVQEVSALADLVTMMKVLDAELAGQPKLREVPQRKTNVAALRHEDKVWYRVHLEAVRDDEADALFVDYGKRERVRLDGLKALPEAFHNIPAFATSVHLHGIEDVDAAVGACLEGQVFEAEVVEVSGKRPTVKLYVGEDGQCINEVLKELSDTVT